MASAPVEADGGDEIDATTVVPTGLPELLAGAHRRLPVGVRVTLVLPDEAAMTPTRVRDVVVGAGFTPGARRGRDGIGRRTLKITRQRTLPDRVGPDMALLVCGLNPSVYSADIGIGFGRPGNRFWPAALAAGLATRDRDPGDALHRHHVGMTDLVKRATPRADALAVEEYRAGLARVTRLVEWLRPGVVCFVGLSGWRAAADRHAAAGWQADMLGGTAVYLMSSTSGLNAHATLATLTEHLRTAAAGPPHLRTGVGNRGQDPGCRRRLRQSDQPYQPARSSTTSVEPNELKIEILPLSPTLMDDRLGTVW